jgi:hypothetical protein
MQGLADEIMKTDHGFGGYRLSRTMASVSLDSVSMIPFGSYGFQRWMIFTYSWQI